MREALGDRDAAGLDDEVIEREATYRHPPTYPMDPATGRGDVHAGFAFVAHRAVVDVDVELGLARVAQLACAQDVGCAVNPLALEGQLEGGGLQGLGLAMMEELLVQDGVIVNRAFGEYRIPTVADAPDMPSVVLELEHPDAPYGVTGVGELACITATPAVLAALRAATGHELTRAPVGPEDLVAVGGFQRDHHAMPVAASRGIRGGAYTLLTPANRYASRLPNLRGALVFKLVTPRLAPRASASTCSPSRRAAARRSPCGPASRTSCTCSAATSRCARTGSPPSWRRAAGATCRRTRTSRSRPAARRRSWLWLKRRYEPWPGLGAPEARSGHRDDEPFDANTGVAGFRRRELLDPADPRYDFNMSLLAFDPGVGLDKVEVHDEEHGLYMTAGGGLYHLGGNQHEVTQDDFIYMAPYCPQSFVATGAGPAEYLLYKDVYRDGF